MNARAGFETVPTACSAGLADAMLARTAARWLAACAACAGSVALLCAAGAFVLLVSRGSWLAALVLVLLPLERVLWLRLRFDAGLFQDLAEAGPAMAMPALDTALHTLGLRAADATPRPLADRVRGAQRLVQQHAVMVLAQLALLGTALLLGAVS